MPIAFPGADGFGKNATGGRGGLVVFVTNTNDSGVGSFRSAVDGINPARIVCVMVNGTVNLLSNIGLRSNKTILGHLANGDGICLKNARLTCIGAVNETGYDNIIIRFLRTRRGDTNGEGASMYFVRTSNLIIDHCSISWGTDETLTLWQTRDTTVQYNMITEALHDSVHSKGVHGFLAFFGGQNCSVHHNLMAHADQRMPALPNPGLYSTEIARTFWKGVTDIRMNVIYNSSAKLGVVNGQDEIGNYIDNYIQNGTQTPLFGDDFILHPTRLTAYPDLPFMNIYMNGNILVGNTTVTADNWEGVRYDRPSDEAFLPSMQASTPYPAEESYDLLENATEARIRVLAHAGCSLSRDSVDTRIISEATNGTTTFVGSKTGFEGVIDSQTDVGGYPTLTGGTVQSAFDNFYNWLIDNGFVGVPTISDYTNTTQLNSFAAYVGQIDVPSGYAIVELYSHALVEDLIAITPPDPEIDPQTVTLEARLNTGGLGGGTVEFTELIPPVSVPSTTVVEVLATPDSGYEFIAWYRDGLFLSSSDLYEYTVPAYNSTIVALFRLTPITTGKRFRGRKPL